MRWRRQIGHAKQLCQPPFPSDQQSVGWGDIPKSLRYCHSSKMARSGVVFQIAPVTDIITDKNTQYSRTDASNGGFGGATEKSSLENVYFEDLWRSRLSRAGWSKRAIEQFLLRWAKSTLVQYNRQIQRYAEYCQRQGVRFPCNKEHVLVDFFCEIADGSEQPKSQVALSVVALSCLFQALVVENAAQSRTVSILVDGLVKSATMKPMVKTPIVPIKPFLQLF